MNKLSLGVSQKVITPEIGCMLYGYPSKPIATGVHDDLTASVYVFTYEDKIVIMASLTICVLRTDIALELREEISKKFNVPIENIILSATHTHSGPSLAGMFSLWGGFDTKYYNEIFKPNLYLAIEEALANVEPVTMATGYGKSNVGINRRELTDENTIDFGQCEWGPYNPEMTVISFKNEQDKIKGIIVSYGAHGTAAGATTLITRDWSGYVVDALAEKTGAVTGFFLGPEGDVAPRLKKDQPGDRINQYEELGKDAARDALKIFENISEYKEVTLDIRKDNLKIPLNPVMDYEDVVEEIKTISPESKKTKDVVRLDYLENHVQPALENGYNPIEFSELEQIVLRIGDIAFTFTPYELFSELGLRIDKMVKDLKVLSIVTTNGQGGYFPTQSQICLGGYEILLFKNRGVQTYVDDADFHYIKETVKNVNNLKR